jgi:hypothetical protein
MNSGLERIRKEAVVAEFEVELWQFPGRAAKPKINSDGIYIIQTEI